MGEKREVLGSTDLDTFELTFRQYKPIGVGQAFRSIVPPALDYNDGTQTFHRRPHGGHGQPSKTIEFNGSLSPKPSKNY